MALVFTSDGVLQRDPVPRSMAGRSPSSLSPHSCLSRTAWESARRLSVSQREVGSRKGVAVLKAKVKEFAESVRSLLEEDDLAGLSAHATARELNRRGVSSPGVELGPQTQC